MFMDALGALALRNFARANAMVGLYTRQLSSGLRISSAADDPAGFVIAEHMETQIRGLRQATRNAQDGVSLLQVAEGVMGQISDVLLRMRELSVQAASGTLSPSDREALQKEFAQGIETIRQFATTTEFNTISLLDGSFQHVSLQIGADAGDTLELSIDSMLPEDLDIDDLSLGTLGDAQAAIEGIERARSKVSGARAGVGAMENRLGYTIQGLEVTAENLQASRSRIVDADMAEAAMGLAKAQLQAQVAAWVLTQINVQRQMVLTLLLDGLHAD